MKNRKQIKLLATLPIALLASCTATPTTVMEEAQYNELVDNYELENGNGYIIVNKGDTSLTTISLTKEQLDSLKEIKYFKIHYSELDGKDSLKTIEKIAEDTTIKRKLLVANEDNIEDYKKRKEGSYTIIELEDGKGMIIVDTPSEEISRMLRIESFNFYYYKNWDGKYYFDHIEESTDK